MQVTAWKKYEVNFPASLLYVALKSIIVFSELQSSFIICCYAALYDGLWLQKVLW